MLRKTAVLALALCFALQGAAQEGVYINGSDTLHYSYTPLPEQPQPQKRLSFPRRVVKYFEGSTRDRTFEKKIDFTFAGGPSYSKNTSLGIGLLAAGLYRIDRTDSVTSPSDISIFANVSISGFYALGVTGNNIFSRNGKRIDYTVMFASAPRDMWGIGYNDGRYNEESSYNEKRYLIKARYLHRVLPNTYVGGILSFEHTQGKKFKPLGESYLYGQKTHYTATGVGAILEYDSRDFPTPSGASTSVCRRRCFPRDWATADVRCGARPSRPTTTGRCGRAASSRRTSTRSSTPREPRGRCWPAWAVRSGCAAIIRAATRTTT